ncbi:MAG: hypothetical protein ACXV2C_00720 [Candidatus Bathyarchaeia archaeon]
MNKMLSTDELLQSSVPFLSMTRKEKLMRWAKLVRNETGHLYLYHNLEYASPEQLANHPSMVVYASDTICKSAFTIAYEDPIFQDAGLKKVVKFSEPTVGNIADVMKFMELSQAELHEFSCDCGGEISNKDMANRIEKIANPNVPTFMMKITSVFR